MIFEERPAPPGLEDSIGCVRYLEAPRVRPYEKILPQPAMHLIVNLSGPYVRIDSRGTATTVEDAFFSGLQSEYLVIAPPPVIRHILVEVRPAGLRAVSDLAGTEVAGRVRPAAEVVPDAAGLVAAVRDAAGPAQALERTQDWLARAAGRAPDPLVSAAVAAIEQRPGTPIGELAEELGVSHRTLIAHFRGATGLTPRDYAQAWRFHRFVTRVAPLPAGEGWAALAPRGGYYDQAHVIRAFRRFSGWTPEEYRRRVARFGPDAATFVPLDEVPAMTQPARS